MQKKIVKFVSVLLTIFLLMGCVFCLFRLLNKKTDKDEDPIVPEFSLSLDNQTIDSDTGLAMYLDQDYKIVVNGARLENLTIKVVPHVLDSTDFTFLVDDVKYTYSNVAELTKNFRIKSYSNYFVISTSKDLPDMVAAQFTGKVNYVPSVIDIAVSYMDLVVTTNDKTVTIPIYLFRYVPPDSLVLNVTEILF